MASFDSINYSVRPSKSIQRNIIFEGMQSLMKEMALENAVYIGLGSIWFTDFVSAHKVLGITDMVSMEGNEVGYRRAKFNRAYRTIDVLHGYTRERLPEILEREGFAARPWVLWLDYDSALSEEIVEDMQWALANVPPNSMVLFTFSASQGAYGKPNARVERLRTLLGAVVPDELEKESCDKETLPLTLSKLTMNFMKSEVSDAARPGGFIEAFKVAYHDSVGMVTVGGVLPSIGCAPAARAVVAGRSWLSIVDDIVEAPPMTLREVSVLQAELPSLGEITRERVRELGFDLQERQIRSFQRYYKYLPSFAEVVA